MEIEALNLSYKASKATLEKKVSNTPYPASGCNEP